MSGPEPKPRRHLFALEISAPEEAGRVQVRDAARVALAAAGIKGQIISLPLPSRPDLERLLLYAVEFLQRAAEHPWDYSVGDLYINAEAAQEKPGLIDFKEIVPVSPSTCEHEFGKPFAPEGRTFQRCGKCRATRLVDGSGEEPMNCRECTNLDIQGGVDLVARNHGLCTVCARAAPPPTLVL